MENIFSKFGNIKSIKSFFILKFIFSNLWENKKLDLIRYTKKIQNKLSIDINDYKKACEKRIIFENDGIIKEYDKINGNLLFEGEHKKGKRNGIGKEYYNNGNILFEGLYLNGKIIKGKKYDIEGNIILLFENEKGEEYYNNGKSKFKGEYYNGRRWNGIGYNYEGNKDFFIDYGKGIGKEYNSNGKLEFEGKN